MSDRINGWASGVTLCFQKMTAKLRTASILHCRLFRFLRGEPAHVTTIESRTLKLGLPA